MAKMIKTAVAFSSGMVARCDMEENLYKEYIKALKIKTIDKYGSSFEALKLAEKNLKKRKK